MKSSSFLFSKIYLNQTVSFNKLQNSRRHYLCRHRFGTQTFILFVALRAAQLHDGVTC